MKRIFAIELSGACNLEAVCKWCPMSQRPRYRKRGLMSDETFKRALTFIEKCGRHEPLYLHNFGEPLLHPKLHEYATVLCEGGPVAMSINGTLVTRDWAERLRTIPWLVEICVSYWGTAQQYADAVRLLQDYELPVSHNDGVTHDFAGQAPEGAKGKKLFKGCQYLNAEMGVIWWDGRVAPCCVTDRDSDAVGTIDQEPETIKVSAFELCPGCHHAL